MSEIAKRWADKTVPAVLGDQTYMDEAERCLQSAIDEACKEYKQQRDYARKQRDSLYMALGDILIALREKDYQTAGISARAAQESLRIEVEGGSHD